MTRPQFRRESRVTHVVIAGDESRKVHIPDGYVVIRRQEEPDAPVKYRALGPKGFESDLLDTVEEAEDAAADHYEEQNPET